MENRSLSQLTQMTILESLHLRDHHFTKLGLKEHKQLKVLQHLNTY